MALSSAPLRSDLDRLLRVDATTGRLDPDMLFYLLSRGLDRETAQSLLVFAFLADVLTGMSVSSARSAIENALISQLPDSQILRKFR